MLTQLETLTFEQTVKAEPDEVFRAFTTPSALRDWLCNAAEAEPRKGGRIYLWWNEGYYTAGVFTELARPGSLAFTWRGPDDERASEVRVAISPAHGGTGSTVTVQHSALPATESHESIEQTRKIWEAGLENLVSVADTGIDLRFSRRPMFGLSGGDLLNTELAERLGVPVQEGFCLGGLVEGMGAQRAGLQKDDVLVRMGDYDINTFASIGAALQKYRAGDRMPVTFYRGPELRTVEVELSQRALAEVPETPEKLAETARNEYSAVDAELDEIFQGVSDVEAEYRRGPGEWSAKDILAHLIVSERDAQAWITATIEDSDMPQPFHANVPQRVNAMVAVYPTLGDLLQELKRNEAVTLMMTATMPEEAARHRHLYYQLGQWLTGFAPHHREHFAEIRSLLAEARQH
jgi:uncharacterized protein YndB with AHSA1/START domain